MIGTSDNNQIPKVVQQNGDVDSTTTVKQPVVWVFSDIQSLFICIIC